MDYKFLNKVIDQLVSETRIDYDMEEIQFPFSFSLFFTLFHFPSRLLLFRLFTKHCRDVYGLNVQEISYVWDEYRETIIDKIKNNGL